MAWTQVIAEELERRQLEGKVELPGMAHRLDWGCGKKKETIKGDSWPEWLLLTEVGETRRGWFGKEI